MTQPLPIGHMYTRNVRVDIGWQQKIEKNPAPPMLSLLSIGVSVSIDAAACLARSPWQPSRLKLANGRDKLENT